jgi:hypothetical protein
MDEPTLARLRALSIGLSCASVEYSPWLSITLSGAGTFNIYTSWRLIHDGGLLAGSPGTDCEREAMSKLLVGQSVSTIQVSDTFNELCLAFSNQARLETFSNSSEFEHWHYLHGVA